MGFWDFVLGRPLTADAVLEPAQTFSTVPASSPWDILGPVSSMIGPPETLYIDRALARQVPAVKRARDIVCGTLGGIPMEVVGPDYVVAFSQLMDQPERNVPRSVTWTRLFEDLFYDGIGWFRITENDYRGYPVKVQRLAPVDVTVTDGVIRVGGRIVPAASVIRFDSPNGGVLTDGARAIRTLLKLENAASLYAEDPMPQGYFAPVEDADPLDDVGVAELLASWKRARQAGVTGYVPAALKYNAVQFTPEQLQMNDARQHAVLEIARITGIDAEDLSVSTTSRTYFNGQDRRMQRISDVLGPYSLAVTDRLRMRDVTPRGYEVRAQFEAFLRADDKTRLENYALAKDLGLYGIETIAAREGLPVALTAEPEPEPPAITQTVQEDDRA